MRPAWRFVRRREGQRATRLRAWVDPSTEDVARRWISSVAESVDYPAFRLT